MAPKILITGVAGAVKPAFITALIEHLGARPGGPLRGFYTTELTEGEKRAGFKLRVIGGASKVFAHVNFAGAQRVGKYGVDIKTFEEFAIPAIQAAIADGAPLLIDEIGKMELLSIRFKRNVLRALEADSPVVATVMSKPHPFIDQIQQRPGLTWLNAGEAETEAAAAALVEQVAAALQPASAPDTDTPET